MKGSHHKIAAKSIAKLLALVLVILLFANLATVETFLQRDINQYLFHSSCDTPIHYKIGNVDPRFNLSRDQFLNDVKTATTIWDRVEGKTLFVYDPGETSGLVVSLTFDQRQQLNNQINNLEGQLNQSNQNIQPQIDQYNQEKANFEKQLADLNSQIESWNQKGGAPPDIYSQLTAQQNSLQQEANKLNQEAQQLNLSTSSYNFNVNKLNSTISAYDEALLQRPEEGLFDPNADTITIYFNNGYDELIHTLAHEFGHSLGLDHNQNKLSIMYPYTTQQITPSSDDISALNAVCSRQYFSLPSIQALTKFLGK